LHDRIEAAARVLKAEFGVNRGDRVAILSLNRPDYLVLLYACARLGAMLVPLNWRLAAAEQLFILSDASVKVLALEQAFAAILPELEKHLPTTSIVGLDLCPRGQRIRRAAGAGPRRRPPSAYRPLLSAADRLHLRHDGSAQGRGAAAGGAVVERRDEPAHARPQFGRSCADRAAVLSCRRPQHPDTPALHFGATVTILPRFTPEATFAAIRRDRPTLTVLVPAIIQAVTEHPDWLSIDLTSLKAVSTGSTIVPPHLIERIVARGVPVLQVYGSTETCPVAIYTRLGGDLSRAGSTGLAGLCCEAAVIDHAGHDLPPEMPGEIVVRGPTYSLNIGAMRKQPARRCTTAGIAPATSAGATRTAISGCTTARRT